MYVHLKRIFGPKRDEVTGEWKKIHNDELNNLYSSPNIVRVIKSRRMRWAGHVARMGEARDVHRVLVGKTEGRRPLGRPRRRWEDNIRMDLREVRCGCVDWMELAQDRDMWRDRHPCPWWDSKPAISTGERPQTYALDRAATGTGYECVYRPENDHGR